MEFIEVLYEVESWRHSVKTSVVTVTDPEVYKAYMCEYHPQNPRHLIDTVEKFQPLLTWTDCCSFAKVLMAFQYDCKYFVLFEYFEEVSESLSLEQIQEACKEAEKGLRFIHNKNSYHGDICVDNIKITDKGVKIVGWTLPKMRSFDPEPEINKYEEDIRALRASLAKISGFTEEEILNYRKSQEKVKKCEENEEEIENFDNFQLFYLDGKKLMALNKQGTQVKICETWVPKGSCLSLYKGMLLLSGGDANDYELKEFETNKKEWRSKDRLRTAHKYHSCIEFQGELWIVGGIRSSKCELFDGNSWKIGPDFCEHAENPTCSVLDTLYVYSKGIYKLIRNDWVRIFVWDLIGFQGVNLDETRILIFGGRTNFQYNFDNLVYNQNTNSVAIISEGSSGLYGLFTYFIHNSSLTIPSNTGKLKTIRLDLIN